MTFIRFFMADLDTYSRSPMTRCSPTFMECNRGAAAAEEEEEGAAAAAEEDAMAAADEEDAVVS